MKNMYENVYCLFSYTFPVKRSLHSPFPPDCCFQHLSLHYPLLAKVAQSIIKATECRLETAMKTHIHIKHFSTFVKLLITYTQKKELSLLLSLASLSLSLCPFLNVLILLRLFCQGTTLQFTHYRKVNPKEPACNYEKPFPLLMLTFHLRGLSSLTGSCKAPLCL